MKFLASKMKKDASKQFLNNISKLRKARVLVGVPQSASARNGEMNNATIAFIQDRGSPAQNIPASGFMDRGIKNAKKDISAILAQGAKDGIDNPEKVKQSLGRAGLKAQSSIRNVIDKQDGFEPLSPVTIKARQKAKPKIQGTKRLLATGQLLKSIQWVIKDG